MVNQWEVDKCSNHVKLTPSGTVLETASVAREAEPNRLGTEDACNPSLKEAAAHYGADLPKQRKGRRRAPRELSNLATKVSAAVSYLQFGVGCVDQPVAQDGMPVLNVRAAAVQEKTGQLMRPGRNATGRRPHAQHTEIACTTAGL